MVYRIQFVRNYSKLLLFSLQFCYDIYIYLNHVFSIHLWVDLFIRFYFFVKGYLDIRSEQSRINCKSERFKISIQKNKLTIKSIIDDKVDRIYSFKLYGKLKRWKEGLGKEWRKNKPSMKCMHMADYLLTLRQKKKFTTTPIVTFLLNFLKTKEKKSCDRKNKQKNIKKSMNFQIWDVKFGLTSW